MPVSGSYARGDGTYEVDTAKSPALGRPEVLTE